MVQHRNPVHKAIVKSVLSGDTVILRGKPRPNGPPLERLLALSNVQAPRLGNRDRDDEPFAFNSREFLRKLLVGKEVSFVPEYTITTTNPPREYGSIMLATGETVAELGVKEGWLKVREGRNRDEEKEAVLDHLLNLEEEARQAQRGLWNTDAEGIREVAYNFEGDARAFLSKYKGKLLDAIIEQVRDASTFRVLLMLPDNSQQIITLLLTGIKAPSCKRENGPEISEPFSEEAKYFVETRLLQRGVKVVLEGLGQSGGQNFVGSVKHPAGNITELLLANGYARCVDWSMTLVTGGPMQLRNAERIAKEKKLRVWRDFVAKEKTSDSEFEATVIRIVTGDTILVKTKAGSERKLQLSSVKQAPRGIGSTAPGGSGKSRDIKEVGYQFEAREFLRKKLIGKTVNIAIDYHKPAQDGFEAKDCATVKLGQTNIAEQLVERGLATVIRHRKDDDNRSQNYDQLLLAESKAQEGQKGLHSTKEQPVVRIVDASESAGKQNVSKSRQFLTFLKRSGKQKAVVDHAVNGSRLFLWVPKENCRLVFVLAGVRAPRVGKTPNERSEPYGQEALDYVIEHCLQRDVEIQVDNVDKVGSFIGTIFINGENLALALLERGLATVHDFSANESQYSSQLYNAERTARAARKGLWKDYNEEAERLAENAEDLDVVVEPRREYIDLVISEYISGHRFYIQVINEDVRKLETLMREMSQYHTSRGSMDSGHKPRVGDLISARFTEDDSWYRAKVRRVSTSGVEVIYIDYGNSEFIPITRVRPLPDQFKALKPQAQEAVLSFVKGPNREDDFGDESLECLRDLTGGKQLVANIDAHEGGVLCLTLYDPSTSSDAQASLNLEMVRSGALLVNPSVRYAAANTQAMKSLQQAQESARRERIGLFVYGDPSSEDQAI
ncbi:hypothetical protein BX666DRAFT_1876151 [Dichotomocladium elegans]|nr:hypothetical protein BX666DRAFT_1876151 [Dichotomocladium elegans]